MRTSPFAMRLLRARRAPAAAVLVALLVALAACGGSDDDATSPTTTEVAGSPTTEPSDPADTTEGTDDPAATTTEGATTEPEEPAGTSAEAGPTTAEVAAELDRLYADYLAALVSARDRGGIDEQFRGDLARIFLPTLLANELAGIDSIGGVAALVPAPGPVAITEVDVEVSQPACASGSAVFDLTPVVGDAVPGPLVRYFKIEVSDAQPGWRFAALGSTADGETFAGASCEEG